MTRPWRALGLALLAGAVFLAGAPCTGKAQAQPAATMTKAVPPIDPFLQKLLDEAAAMPLKDAAFQLWRWKYNFDSHELPSPRPVDTKDPEVMAKLANADFMTIYRFERANAHDGITFDRMKRIHPHATDADIKAAIKAAMKMWDDCEKHFDANYTDMTAAVHHAITRAKRVNPGFLDETWSKAGSALMYFYK